MLLTGVAIIFDLLKDLTIWVMTFVDKDTHAGFMTNRRRPMHENLEWLSRALVNQAFI